VWKCYRLCIFAGAATSLFSSAGSFVKIFYVDRKQDGLTRPIASIFAEKYFDVCLPLGLGAAGFFLYQYSVGEKMVLPILIAVIILLYVLAVVIIKAFRILMMSFMLKKPEAKNSMTLLLDFESAIDIKNYLLSVVEFSLGGFIRVFILIQALSIGCNFVVSVMIISLNSFVDFIPVSYLGIGTRDAGMIGIFELFGYGSEQAVALSIAMLLSRLIFVFMGAVFWMLNPPVAGKT
jgi:hypothetical protein